MNTLHGLSQALPATLVRHRCHCRVIYGDTDGMGIAYHANYLRWFETGRTEMFRALGLPYREIEQRGFALPVSEAYCKFLAPARYDDLLSIDTMLEPIVRGAMTFHYRIFDAPGLQELASGYTRHAYMDREGRVVRPPEFIRAVIASAAERLAAPANGEAYAP